MNNFSVVNTIKALTMLELSDDKEITLDMIKSNYHKLCLIYHPDQANVRYKDGEKFCQLKEARDYLTINLAAVNNQIRNNFQDGSSSNKNYTYYQNYSQEETRKKQAETARQAEEARRKQAEAARQAEEARRKQAEAARQAEGARKKQAEATRQAEEARYRADAIRKAEYMKREKERAAKKRKERWRDFCIAAVSVFFIFVLFYAGIGDPFHDSSDKGGSSSSSKTNMTSTPAPQATVVPSTKAADNVARPENGTVLYCRFGDTPSGIEIENQTNYDILVQYDSETYGTNVYSFYVRGNSNVKLASPQGRYTIKYFTGTTWYGDNQKFGVKGQYSSLNNGNETEFSWGENKSFIVKKNIVKGEESNNTYTNQKTATESNKTAGTSSGTLKAVNQRNGFIKRPTGNCLAPLKIHASNNASCFVSVTRYGSTSQYYSIFINEGTTVEVDVPLGKYEIYYCTGETWYGTEEYFGKDTVFFKADDVFQFSESGDYYTGHEITLYTVANGNLDTDRINETTFPK